MSFMPKKTLTQAQTHHLYIHMENLYIYTYGKFVILLRTKLSPEYLYLEIVTSASVMSFILLSGGMCFSR